MQVTEWPLRPRSRLEKGGRLWTGRPNRSADTALDKSMGVNLFFSNQCLKTEGRGLKVKEIKDGEETNLKFQPCLLPAFGISGT